MIIFSVILQCWNFSPIYQDILGGSYSHSLGVVSSVGQSNITQFNINDILT